MKPVSRFDLSNRARKLIATAHVLLAILVMVTTTGCPAADNDLLPAPTGAQKTGRMSFHWKDEARDELETSAPGDRRELMVHLFYPADARAAGQRAPYVPDADAMRGLWTEDQLTRITALRAYSLENVELPAGQARYPVVIFSPGGGMKGLIYHAFFEDLASHGWVVAAIDPPYNARSVRFPDGRVLGNLSANERGWPEPRSGEERQRFYRERIVHWARDISFVIDRLAALDRGNGRFARRLDLDRGVGVFGHSRGGQAAGMVRLLDARVRGGINLDGTIGDRPVLSADGEDVAGTQPFLWILKPPPPPTDEQLQRRGMTRAEFDAGLERFVSNLDRRLGTIAGGAIRLHFNRPGIEHIDFSDEPFWDGHVTAAMRPGKLQTIADTRVWVRGFFEGTLLGDWTALKRLAGEGQSSPPAEVTVRSYGRMWP